MTISTGRKISSPGIVQRQDHRFYYIDLGKTEALLPVQEKMPTDHLKHRDRIKTYITKVERTTKGPQIMVSRTHPGLLKRLFELEVPEIYDGIVEIKSVAREAGDRSKIAVYAHDPDVDPVGACVGPKGMRVQTVVEELNGEKIDIVKWSDDPVEFVSNALSPSKVIYVDVNEEEKVTRVVVPDYQLSLAIGKRGQNARLAAKLTGWKIDIKSESQAEEEGLLEEEESGWPVGEDAPDETTEWDEAFDEAYDDDIEDEDYDNDAYDDEYDEEDDAVDEYDEEMEEEDSEESLDKKVIPEDS